MPKNLPDPDNLEAWLQIVDDESMAHTAIRSENCPVQAMEKALRDFPNLEGQVVYNPEAPSRILEFVFNRVSWGGTRSSIVSHKNVTEKILDVAISDPDDFVRSKVAERTKSLSALTVLSTDKSDSVRLDVARNPNSTPAILETVLEPYLQNIAAAVIANPNCTPLLFESIAKRPIEPGWIAESLLTYAPLEMIEEIYSRVPEDEKPYVMKNPNAPSHLLLSLFTGPHSNRSAYLIRESTKVFLTRLDLTDELLVAAFKASESPEFTWFKPMTPSLAQAIIALKSVDLKVALISNPSANGEMLMELVKDKSKKVQEALNSRSHYGYDSSKNYGQIPFKNRDELWEALEGNAPLAQKKKKLNQKSALDLIFSSTLTKEDLALTTRIYRESLKSNFAPIPESELLDAAANSDQRDRIFACLLVRAAQLGLIPPSQLMEEENRSCMYRVEGATLNYVIDPFLATFDDLNFEIIKQLGQLRKLFGYYEITRLSPTQVLTLIEYANDAYFNWKVATNYPLTPEILTALAESPAYRHSTYREKREDLDLSFGEWAFYSSSGYRVESHPAAIVTVHPLTPAEIVQKLSKSSNQYLRGLFIEDERLFTEEALKKGVKDKSEHVRSLVASHPKTSIEMLELLGSDKSAEVRSAVADNPNTPLEVKAMMALLKG